MMASRSTLELEECITTFPDVPTWRNSVSYWRQRKIQSILLKDVSFATQHMFFRSMIRRLKTDVLLQLPSKQRKMIILDPALVKSKTKEMEAQARRMGQKSLTSAERRGLLLEWFNMTGQYKVKGVLEYLKDLLEGDKKFLCFAHHQVAFISPSS